MGQELYDTMIIGRAGRRRGRSLDRQKKAQDLSHHAGCDDPDQQNNRVRAAAAAYHYILDIRRYRPGAERED
jgi:hypothetical protein